MNEINYIVDSNAPPQIRGIPFQGSRLKAQSSRLEGPRFFRNARGAPVVAQQQPQVHGRQLSKLRDGPTNELAVYSHSLLKKSTWLKANCSKLNWSRYAPPDTEFSVALCESSVNFVVREKINHREHKEDAKNTKSEVKRSVWSGDEIRSKSFVLRDEKSLTGGRLMIERLND